MYAIILSVLLSQVQVEFPAQGRCLEPSELPAFAAWASERWPAITPSEVQLLRCVRQRNEGVLGALCYAVVETTLSAADVLLAVDDLVRPPRPSEIAADGSSATVLLRYGVDFFANGNLTGLVEAVNTVAPGVGGLQRILIRDVPATDDHPSCYWLSVARRRSRTAQEWLSCRRDGSCTQPITD